MSSMSSNGLKDQEQVFRSNTLMILIPGLFFGTALLLRGQAIQVVVWILLIIGAITTIAVVRGFTTISISADQIRIQNLSKSHVINKTNIVKQTRSVSTAKGIETVEWKLEQRSGEVVTISSDLIKEQEGLKQSLDQFLKGIPKK